MLASDRPIDELAPLVYDELRRLAGSFLRNERAGHTLQATSLVNEAYLQLVQQDRVSWTGRTHFMAVCAKSMRRLLVSHARKRDAQKRGGDWARVTLSGVPVDTDAIGLEDVLDLDRALSRLEALNERHAKVFECRCFGGMTFEEVASELGVSTRTIERDWVVATAWIRRELAESSVS